MEYLEVFFLSITKYTFSFLWRFLLLPSLSFQKLQSCFPSLLHVSGSDSRIQHLSHFQGYKVTSMWKHWPYPDPTSTRWAPGARGACSHARLRISVGLSWVSGHSSELSQNSTNGWTLPSPIAISFPTDKTLNNQQVAQTSHYVPGRGRNFHVFRLALPIKYQQKL